MLYEYSGTIISDLNSVKYCLEEIISDLEKILVDEDLIFDLRLILNELVINSAIHGNNLEESKKIKIDIEMKRDELEISVEDEGEGIDYDLDSYDPKRLDCCGRGLFLVNNLSDQCIIDKNRVLVYKKIEN